MGDHVTARLHTKDKVQDFDVEGVFFVNDETHGHAEKLCQGDDREMLFVNAAANDLLAVEIRDTQT